ncbi:FAD-binding oxidoreductase [Vibrio sp. Of7-15]|uniref:styrene monooxygenase/indole monooxygenase family protein n=1 Tax=Vibrio sp. Of7-15 TaxID=2724879 RepID=UPI001EF3B68C|nr:FAD-binding oxidoreductase [Vibrio sp. Of7-15]
MRKITIIGAGQAGLLLGHGLLQHGYQVKIITDKTPEHVTNGSILSTQCLFGSSLAIEQELGLDNWHTQEPSIQHMKVCITDPETLGTKMIEWQGKLNKPALSVDQRVKFPQWMAEFEAKGGELVIKEVTDDDLNHYAEHSDLVIIASGKGYLKQLFQIHRERSPFKKPQRKLTAVYVSNPHTAPRSSVSANFIPGVGEYFAIPVLSHSGPCEALLFEATNSSAMDCFSRVDTPQAVLDKAKSLLKEYLPWEYEHHKEAQIIDSNASLLGYITPTVRHPVAKLASGASVLGIADTVCVNDPITGQGANNATKAAKVYLSQILEHGDKEFDDQWMSATFERFWEEAQWSTQWSNMMLTPPPEFVLNLLGSAMKYPQLADRLANAFDDPQDLFPWFADPQETEQYLASMAANN